VLAATIGTAHAQFMQPYQQPQTFQQQPVFPFLQSPMPQYHAPPAMFTQPMPPPPPIQPMIIYRGSGQTSGF
jgi:hypothetical protein